MRTVAIVGVGLIGGSFGLALRKAGFAGEILGVSSTRSIEQAKERGAVDRGASLEDAAASADLIFLSQPISGIVETLGRLDPLVRPEALVTDAGSTKKWIGDTASQVLHRCAFLGGHPMAGKEKRGASEADAELFLGRPWVLTADSTHPVAAEFRRWIRMFGAREVILDAAEHDRLVAWSSHLPQLASTALASALQTHAPDAIRVGGPGLFDTTRLALSAYDLWRDILVTNQTEVGAALDAYIARLQALRGLLDGDMSREFAEGSAFAESLRRKN